MTSDSALVGLPAGLSAEEAAAQFDALQKKLVPLWRSIESLQPGRTNHRGRALDVDRHGRHRPGSAGLRRALSFSSSPPHPAARAHDLCHLAGDSSERDRILSRSAPGHHPAPCPAPAHLARALSTIQPRPLSLKVLERPRLLQQIEAGIADKNRAHLVCYNTTYLERNLALRLGIPLYGADPRHLSFGTKTGCRKLFAKAGINHPLGFDNLHSLDEVVAALRQMRAQRPSIAQAVVKLNEGVSGEGNALVDLTNMERA